MDLERYKRQVALNEIGENRQKQLAEKKAVIIGGGGLGSNSANILVRFGIGSIDIFDNDVVEISNLHRMSIFSEEDIGLLKSQILSKKLKKINSDLEIQGFKKLITKKNIESISKDADIIIDGTDNLKVRFLINELSIKKGIPWVYAGVKNTIGMVMAINPGITPCFKCMSPTFKNDKKIEIPVLGNLPITIASIQCTEALKLLLGQKTSGLIIYDIWKQLFENIKIKKNSDCECCNKRRFEYL